MSQHSRQSSNEVLNFVYNYPSAADFANQHYHATTRTHSRNQSMELKQMKTDLGILLSGGGGGGGADSHHSSASSHYGGALAKNGTSNMQVNVIVGHHNWIAVAYTHFVCCYKLKDGMGWQLVSIRKF